MVAFRYSRMVLDFLPWITTGWLDFDMGFTCSPNRMLFKLLKYDLVYYSDLPRVNHHSKFESVRERERGGGVTGYHTTILVRIMNAI